MRQSSSRLAARLAASRRCRVRHYRSDLEIAQAATMRPIAAVASDALGIDEQHLEPYGRYKAKVSLDYLGGLADRSDGKLILVTAMSPTPAGEGKTLTTIGLGDALNRIGKRAALALREPSLGPVFGIKGGAAGGGRSQLMPMEDINLHFTGDFAAIGLAHSLLAAMLDNHIHHGNELDIDVRRVQLRRVVDMNDRALREVTIGLGGLVGGVPRQDGFDIVVASEVMAIFCLATSLADLRTRLGNIVVAYTRARAPVTARDLGAHGAMAALLRDAIAPNLVQTLEHTPAFVHGGPFANIAHGCNSVLATRAALQLADYVVTEAGFGADLGAEKFVGIKCRKSGLRPAAAVVVATARAVKYHGGAAPARLAEEDAGALERGVANLARHVENVREHYGIPAVVSINRFAADSPAELARLHALVEARLGVRAVLSDGWSRGGEGVLPLAEAVVGLCERPRAALRFVYDDADTLAEKVTKVATAVYRASAVSLAPAVRRQLARLEEEGHGALPVCVAKTQSSFSTDPTARGAPVNHVVHVREARLAAGAGFVVMICGDVMTMPGLPRTPAACKIDVDQAGNIVGLF